MSRPVVAIVGRPNVGKSSLFNRLIKKRKAVVEETPGVTRDRNYAECEWSGRDFMLVDTGGIVPESRNKMEQAITEQAQFAIEEADLVLLMVDTLVGLDLIDRKIGKTLQRSSKPSLLVANKADNELLAMEIHEFHSLGLGDPQPVSAMTGRGVGDLLDRLIDLLPPEEALDESADNVIRVAVVGRPNVGKSSYINKLLGQERLLVSDIAGTTRDAVDSAIEVDGQQYVLVDTAGLRRKYKVTENIEFFTYLRTVRAIDNCDVAIVLIDAVDGLTSQDQHVLGQVLESRRGAVLGINKWDLVEKDSKTADLYARDTRDKLAKFSHMPLMFISAMSGQRTEKLMATVKQVYTEHNKRIPTSELNDFLADVLRRLSPAARKGKFIQLKYITQSEIAPPTFIIFSNHPELLDKSYISYLTNQLRATFGYEGVPIRLKFKRS